MSPYFNTTSISSYYFLFLRSVRYAKKEENQMKKNLFIAFEGIDGSGKSTQVKMLAEKLISEGHKVYTTFEPTDSPIGSIIRNIMKGRMQADHKTIAGLFVADRLDHLLNEVNGIVKKMKEELTGEHDKVVTAS